MADITNIYEDYKKTFIWNILRDEINSLEINHDLEITTKPDYIVGSLAKGLVTNPILIEKFAEILWKVHSHSLYPYYNNKKEHEESWLELAEHQVEKSEVSKNFFRTIATNILSGQ